MTSWRQPRNEIPQELQRLRQRLTDIEDAIRSIEALAQMNEERQAHSEIGSE